jgi:hypothetical protein
MVQSRSEINKMFYSSLKSVESNYKEMLTTLELETNSKIDALTSLYESGNYECGKLNEYATMEVYQPKSKRRKYDDDGYRRVILPEKIIKNLLIEDEIYYHFYGIPK